MARRTHSRGEGNIQRTFGQNVLALRTAHNMSQDELAERSGISRSYVSIIEADDINVTLETVVVIARAFGVPAISMLLPPPPRRRKRQSS